MASAATQTPRGAAGRGIALVGRDWELSLATAILGLLVLAAAFGPLLWRMSPLDVDVINALSPPTLDHPLGTDDVGRDVLSRVLAGARVSLAVAVAVTVIGTVLGGAAGLFSGLVGGWVDVVLSRLMDAILAFPPLIFAMAMAIGLGPGATSAMVGVVLTAIPWYFRLLRGEVLRLRGLAFVESARALGVGTVPLVVRHILPQTTSTLCIQAAAVFSFSILTLAALGFVGLGVQPPTPEWGGMITEGMAYALTGQWWMSVFPGLCVFLVAVSASMIADRLRDLFDPRSRTGL